MDTSVWLLIGALVLLLMAGAAAVLLVGMLAGLDTDPERIEQLRRLFPVGCLAFVGLVVTAAVASGGGREIIHRDGAAAYPVSPVVDHLGALLLALIMPIAGFLARNPLGGQHHLAFEVPDIDEAHQWFSGHSKRILGTIRIGAHGTPVFFVHPKDMGGVLTEIVEPANGH